MSVGTADFTSDLAFSQAHAHEEWWEEVYRSAFPDFDEMAQVSEDGAAQRAGVDRFVKLKGGRIITIDEKVRREKYPDIVLEFWSNKQARVPGWVAKPAWTDWIAYAVKPTRTCYLLPFQSLRKAWKEHHDDWVALYGARETQNREYTTVWCPVPVDVLFNAMSGAMTVGWDK